MLKKAAIGGTREPGGCSGTLFTILTVLGLAAQCAAAPATSVLSNLTSPAGTIFAGTHLWVADAALGFCRLDPGGAGGSGVPGAVTGPLQLNAGTCVNPATNNPGTRPLTGQPSYDGARHFVYLPDKGAGSLGIWRYTFNPNSETFSGPVNVAPGLGAQRPATSTLGPDGTLYAGSTTSGSLFRVNTPFAASQVVDNMATTLSGSPALGLALVGQFQLWIAEPGAVTILPNAPGCGVKCKGIADSRIGRVGRVTNLAPTTLTWDATASMLYIGVPEGVLRYNPLTGLPDFYSGSYVANGLPGLFSNVTGLGVDGAGNLFIGDDPTAGQTPKGSTLYSVPAGSEPDGPGGTVSPPSPVIPTVDPVARFNFASLYAQGLTTPKGAVWMGTHVWVVDGARGLCRIGSTRAIDICATLPAGVVPGSPAFDKTRNLLYLPDTTPAGAGILRFTFNTVTETLNTAPVKVVNGNLVPGGPTAVTLGPDGQLYAAVAGSANILRITNPSTATGAINATHTVKSIGALSESTGSPSLAFLNADLWALELLDVPELATATLCLGACQGLPMGILFTTPSSLTSDAGFLYIGDGFHVWQFDPVANTLRNIADAGSINGVISSFTNVSGLALDGQGNIYAAEGTHLWKIATGPAAIASLAPSQAPEGSTVAVTITGSNFLPELVVNTCPAITPGNVTVVSPTQISATFTIQPLGPLGACDITVTTLTGTTAASTFTVLVPPPALGAVTPASGFRGQTVPVGITGTNMAGGTLSAMPGITISGVAVADTLVTANFAIAPTATLGPRSVIVTTPSGLSNALTFTVNAAPPVLNTIAPNQSAANKTVAVTIAGTDLSGAALNLPAGITLSGTPVVTGTSITATLVIASTVPAGPQSITVTTLGGVSNGVTFTILPALTTITPAVARAGSATSVVLAGTSLAGITSINAGANIAVSGIVATAGQVTATFTSPVNAPVGPQAITVSDANGTSNAVTFTITAPVPVLTGINPLQGGTGATVPVTLTGTGLTGASLNLPAGVTLVPGTLINNSFTTVSASLLIAVNAPLGLKTISVTTPGTGNTSNGLGFTIFALAPLLNTTAPSTAAAGSTLAVTLNGQGFTGATSVNALGTGISVSGFNVNLAGTQITATFVIALDATAQGISVTTPNGTSNAVTFGIVPTLTSVSPAVGTAGKSVAVTLTGTSLTAATGITTGTAGITVSNAVVVSSTQITATFVIAANAILGNHRIAVVTPAGTTAQVINFNVLPPAPVISSMNNTTISKAAGTIGMTVNGTNLGGLPVSSVRVLLNGVQVGAGIVTIANFVPGQTQIRFNWTFLAAAPVSSAGNSYTLTVTTASGTSNAFPFTVTN
jgi:hypothetical protein